jgi:hypothetical protein
VVKQNSDCKINIATELISKVFNASNTLSTYFHTWRDYNPAICRYIDCRLSLTLEQVYICTTFFAAIGMCEPATCVKTSHILGILI